MKQKFRFKALDYHGKVIHFTEEFNCPDFTLIPGKELHGYPLPKTSIENQLMDWLDEQDLGELMIKKELGVIIDYWIPKKKTTKVTIEDYIRMADMPDGVRTDLMATYAVIKDSLKGKTVESQIEILFSHIDVAYRAAKTAYRNVHEILTPSGSSNTSKLEKMQNKYLGL